MLEHVRLKLLIKKRQSLKYQIMILLMEEHMKARLGKDHIGNYDAGNELWFGKSDWDKMKSKIYDYVSKNYKEKIKISDISYIIGLFSEDDEFCHMEINNIDSSKISISSNIQDGSSAENTSDNNHSSNNIFNAKFTLTDSGYSYQYNGYKRTHDKLQMRANQFVLITFIYYVCSWLIKDPLDSFSKIFKWLWKIMSNLKIDISLIPTILFVLLVIGGIKWFYNNR